MKIDLEDSDIEKIADKVREGLLEVGTDLKQYAAGEGKQLALEYIDYVSDDMKEFGKQSIKKASRVEVLKLLCKGGEKPDEEKVKEAIRLGDMLMDERTDVVEDLADGGVFVGAAHRHNSELPTVHRSFDRMLRRAYRRGGASLRQRAQLAYVLSRDDMVEKMGTSMRVMLATKLTKVCQEVGALPVSGGQIVDGCYVGDWTDIWQIIMDNLPMIFEFVIQIILLFI